MDHIPAQRQHLWSVSYQPFQRLESVNLSVLSLDETLLLLLLPVWLLHHSKPDSQRQVVQFGADSQTKRKSLSLLQLIQNEATRLLPGRRHIIFLASPHRRHVHKLFLKMLTPSKLFPKSYSGALLYQTMTVILLSGPLEFGTKTSDSICSLLWFHDIHKARKCPEVDSSPSPPWSCGTIWLCQCLCQKAFDSVMFWTSRLTNKLWAGFILKCGQQMSVYLNEAIGSSSRMFTCHYLSQFGVALMREACWKWRGSSSGDRHAQKLIHTSDGGFLGKDGLSLPISTFQKLVWNAWT